MLDIGSIKRKQRSRGINLKKKKDTAFLKTLKTKILKDPTTSMRIDPKTIRKAVHTDLYLRSYMKTETPTDPWKENWRAWKGQRCVVMFESQWTNQRKLFK